MMAEDLVDHLIAVFGQDRLFVGSLGRRDESRRYILLLKGLLLLPFLLVDEERLFFDARRGGELAAGATGALTVDA